MALKSIRVLANANNKTLRTVNIVTSQTGHTFEQRQQQTTDNREWETVQAADAPTAGLKTVCIPGYTGPA